MGNKTKSKHRFLSVTHTESNTSSRNKHEVRLGRISVAVSYFSSVYSHELELFVPQVNGSKILHFHGHIMLVLVLPMKIYIAATRFLIRFHEMCIRSRNHFRYR